MSQHPKSDKSSEKDSSSSSSSFFYGTHHYETTSLPICNTRRDGGCSRESVYETMMSSRSYVTPSSQKDPVTDGSTTSIPVLGPVKHTRDDEHFTVTNTTEPSHVLHPGTVQRTVEERPNGDIVVKTTGDGEGLAPGLNNYFASNLWGRVDSGLEHAVREKSGEKKEEIKRKTNFLF